MSIKGNEFMQKVDNLLGNEKELIILKGMLFNPNKNTTKDGKDSYYTFSLKTLKGNSTDEYGQTFNTYRLIMPVMQSKKFSDEEISGLKNCEVLCLCSTSARVKKIGENGVLVNNITLYVDDLMLLRTVDVSHKVQAVINL